MSTLTQAMLINGIVLFAVLEADLGPHRTIGRFRIVRPLLMAAGIVPLFLTALTTQGTGVVLEIAGAVAGLLGGLLAVSQLTVYRSPRTSKPVSRAGFGYAAVWIAVIGARAAFSYGATNWFGSQLGTWCQAHSVTADDITNTLVLMAVTMTLTRTVALAARAATTPATTTAAIAQPGSTDSTDFADSTDLAAPVILARVSGR
jgi:hypothetical protein